VTGSRVLREDATTATAIGDHKIARAMAMLDEKRSSLRRQSVSGPRMWC
jgi:hypothetical protein